MRQLGAWKAGLPALSTPPPRTLEEVFAINGQLGRMSDPVVRDDETAMAQHVRFRNSLLRLHARSPNSPRSRER